jgi:diguanylate cyclase
MTQDLGQMVELRTQELVGKNAQLERAMINMKHIAFHDELTGLPNRRLLKDQLNLAITHAHENHDFVAVLFLDLDRFKNINDYLGHQTGDLVLQKIAERLEKVIREPNTVSRQGGDEFTIILTELKSISDIREIVENIQASMAQPLFLKKNDLHIQASIGIAVYPYDGVHAEILMKHADNAMYRAKESGRNQCQYFTLEMNESLSRSVILENDLYKAMERNQLVLYYQPQVHIQSQSVIGMEVLLRWEHDELGLISPHEFIPIAEETGLIVPITEWIIQKACEQQIHWRMEGYPALRMSVNLSPRHLLQENFIDSIHNILEQTQIDPQYLELEITERIAMKSAKQVMGKLESLKKMGLGLSIDDFGTGYSSLSYLQKFPINTLKIDRSFVCNITKQNDGVIVKTIIAMAQSLGFTTIAEGVENETQYHFLSNAGCTEIQGYLISKPLPAEDIVCFLENYINK